MLPKKEKRKKKVRLPSGSSLGTFTATTQSYQVMKYKVIVTQQRYSSHVEGSGRLSLVHQGSESVPQMCSAGWCC